MAGFNKKSIIAQLGLGTDIGINDFGQFVKAAGTITMYSGAAFVGAYVTTITATCAEGEASIYWGYNLARMLDMLPSFTRIPYVPLSILGGASPAETVAKAAGYHQMFAVSPYLALLMAIAASSALGAWLVKRFLAKAEEAQMEEFVRGARLSSVKSLIKRVSTVDPVRGWGGASDYKWVGGVPLALGRAQYGILVTGAVGSGKTTAMLYLLDQVAKKGKTMVFFDVVCEFASYYYRAGKDIIFNPYDKRWCSPGEDENGNIIPGSWSIFAEIKERTDPDQIGALFLPIKNHNDNTEVYFKTGAKIVISWLIKLCIKNGTPTQAAFNQYVFNTNPAELHKLAKGTPAEMYLDPEASGTGGGGFITSLRNALYVLTEIKCDGEPTFSIKEFIWRGGDHRMFITTPEAYAEQLQPLTALAFGLAIKASLDNRKMEQTQEDKIWFVADEFSSMGPVPSIYELATKGRKFGALLFAGMQSLTQVEEVMVPLRAKAFLSVMQNVLLMKVSDSETQERYSKEIGKAEMWRASTGVSVGESDAKDSRNVNRAITEVAVVMPAEIGDLSPNSGYLRLAGGYGIAKLNWPGFRPTKIAKDFIQIDGMELNPFACYKKEKVAETDEAKEAKKARVSSFFKELDDEINADSEANEASVYDDQTEPGASNFQDYGEYVPDGEQMPIPAPTEPKPRTSWKM